MKVLLCFAFITICLAASEPEDRARWGLWKLNHQKSYETPLEDEKRFQIYRKNLLLIKELNANRPHSNAAIFGDTQFADLTPKEFKETYLMDEDLYQHRVPVQETSFSSSLPSSYDWNTKGVVTPVKNQGQCGSCWDFSATETIESVCAIAGYPLTGLSEQQILDCDTTDYGCNGGFPWNAYQYVISVGGLDTENNYPYTAEDGSCTFSSAGVYDCKVVSWQYVEQSSNENAMQTFLYENSPLSVCVDAEQWQFYSGGVMMASQCGNTIDHCVQATGWSVVDGYNVWNVRNSWGTSWGENGYIYVQLGANACAIAEYVTVPCVTSTTGSTVC